MIERYSHGRHDDPVPHRYAFARHGRALVDAVKRICIALFGRRVTSSALAGAETPSSSLIGCRVTSSALVGAETLSSSLIGRRVTATGLVGVFEEC